jgi:hypothetical protein
MRTTFALAFGAFAALQGTPCAATESARASFDRLAALAGHWQGTQADGRTHDVDIRPSAAGSVLVETWTLGPGRESMTIYHLDGDRLLATHYCVQGNAPRLARVDEHDGRLEFAFVDGTGLQPEDGWHQHSFWIEPRGDGTFARAETYVQNGTTATDEAEEAVVYRRLAASP